jgi:hypothetical protein
MKQVPCPSSSGQVMILAVLTLGGAILGVTAIAGLLMLYQIRQSTDFQNSAKSIFAADAGVEWALYSYYQPPQGSLPSFSDGASLAVDCYDASDNQLAACDMANSSYAISKGTARDTKRAFFVKLTGATSTLP